MNMEVQSVVRELEIEKWLDEIERKVKGKKFPLNDLEKLKLLFEQKEWQYRIAGQGAMILSPVYTDEFVYVPKEQDNSIIPNEGLERLAVVNELCSVRGVIIGHERKIEAAEHQDFWDDERVRRAVRWAAIGAAVGTAIAIGGYIILPAIAGATAAGTVAVSSTASGASIATTATGSGVSAGTLALGAAALLMVADPVLIVCLSDPEQTLCEIFFWHE